ncbi:hypothetical protein CS537_17845 [Yersinia mollaretii]|nr:hypothetical protein CS537_17845 [Yersinia mollaretii]
MLAALTHPNHLLVLTLRVSKLIGIHSIAAYLQHQFLWVYDVQSFMLKYIAKSMPTFQTPQLCHIIGVC